MFRNMALDKLRCCINQILKNTNRIQIVISARSFPKLQSVLSQWEEPAPCLIGNHGIEYPTTPSSHDITSMFPSFVWYKVPKKIRSLERRLTRKFNQHIMDKYTKNKKRILMCMECGHWYEAGTLCGNCYQKVKRETAEQMERMGDDLKYDSQLKEVVVLYEGEDDRLKDSEGKYIVEMKKEKPQWFSDKLMKKVR